MLKIDSMQIERVVVHTIPSRGPEKTFVAPTGGEPVTLDRTVADLVVTRLTKALGNQSHGVQADFQEVADGSMFMRSCVMMDCSANEFVRHVQDAAEKLTRVQLSKSFSPSKLISMKGSVGNPARPFVAFIKAELEMALTERKRGSESVLEILKNIFMTETQRLYKIGFIARTVGMGKSKGQYAVDQHSVHLFDHLLTANENRNAAFYFYGEFLGADLAVSDKRLTREFLDRTLTFIKSQDYSPRKRMELSEALRAEMRSNDQTVHVADFAKKHLTARDAPEYVAYMKKTGFPEHAVTKDVDYVKTRLKRRKVTFSSGVLLTIPPDIKKAVEITDNKDGTSTVLVKGTVLSDE